MNKLLSNSNGGFPFVLDDLRFMDESVREVLKAQFERFIDANDPTDKGFLITNQIPLVLKGTDVPIAGFPTMDDCFVYISGEIYFLPGSTFPAGISPSTVCFVEPDISFTGTTPGQKVFENGSTVETYQIRRAKYTLTPTQPDFIQITSSTITPQNLSGGFEFEYLVLCNLRQREYKNLLLNDTNELLSQVNSIVQTNTSNINLNTLKLTDIENNWISVPMSTLMRTTNPVFYRCNGYDPGLPGVGYTPISTDCTIVQSASFLKLKRIGKTVFATIKIKSLTMPGYPSAFIGGFFIDLNNLGVPGFTGGTVRSFSGDLIGGSNLPSPCAGNIEVIEANNAVSSGKNGIFIRLQNGTSMNYAQWNINYFYQLTNLGIYTNITKTVLDGDFDNYPSSASWDIKGTLIFEMY